MKVWNKLKIAFSDESPSRATVNRWFAEFKKRQNYLSDESREGRPFSPVTPENIGAVKMMIDSDKRCTYAMIQEALNIGSVAIRNIMPEQLHIKKVLCR